MRMIDADLLMRDIEHYHLSDGKFQHWVEVQPTIERKTGIWRRAEYGYTCNQCGKTHLLRTAYCPSCGAEMDC